MTYSNQSKAGFLSKLETRYCFIEDQFNQAAALLDEHDAKGMFTTDHTPGYKCLSQQPRLWPELSVSPSDDPLTQKHRRDICTSIYNHCISDLDAIPKHKYTVIDFEDGSQDWDEQLFSLNSMILRIRLQGSAETQEYSFSRDDRLAAAIYIRSEHQTAHAYLKAKGADGKDYFYQLDYFCMLYHICDYEDVLESGDSAATDRKKTSETGMFTLFSSEKNIMFLSTY